MELAVRFDMVFVFQEFFSLSAQCFIVWVGVLCQFMQCVG